jgi:uncharacterized phiE125 gp8 family phage protein
MGYKVITPASTTPVSLVDAKKHLKVSGNSEDDLIQLYLEAATNMAEGYLGMKLINTVIEEAYDEFTDISLVRFPTQAITSIKYDAEDTTEKTVSTDIYTLNTYVEPQMIVKNEAESWPIDLADKPNRIRVRYTAGYGSTPASVPANIRAAILVILGDLYENREDKISALPKASTRLLEPWRICRF